MRSIITENIQKKTRAGINQELIQPGSMCDHHRNLLRKKTYKLTKWKFFSIFRHEGVDRSI